MSTPEAATLAAALPAGAPRQGQTEPRPGGPPGSAQAHLPLGPPRARAVGAGGRPGEGRGRRLEHRGSGPPPAGGGWQPSQRDARSPPRPAPAAATPRLWMRCATWTTPSPWSTSSRCCPPSARTASRRPWSRSRGAWRWSGRRGWCARTRCARPSSPSRGERACRWCCVLLALLSGSVPGECRLASVLSASAPAPDGRAPLPPASPPPPSPFCSYYYQAEVQGQVVTWLVPHATSQVGGCRRCPRSQLRLRACCAQPPCCVARLNMCVRGPSVPGPSPLPSPGQH